MALSLSAIDILEKLDGVDIHTLDSLQRILLITDGTLTEILEAAHLERIKLIKLDQKTIPATDAHNILGAQKENVLERKILLQGEKSGKNYAYAESVVAFERLDGVFREALVNSNIPLGRLWLEHKLETFKQLQDIRCQPAEELSVHFKCHETAPLLVRTYSVYSASQVIMLITEYFPLS